MVGDKRRERVFNNESYFILFPSVYVATNNTKIFTSSYKVSVMSVRL